MKKTKKKSSPKARTQNTKKKPSQTSTISKEIVGICLVGISLLVLIGLFTSKSGIVGEIIRLAFIGLFGIGGYLIPLLAVSSGVFYIQGNIKRVVQIVSYGISLILMLITFFHILYFKEATEIPLWSLYYIEEGACCNGGFVGAAIGYLLLNLFGLYGAYVILGVLMGVWLLIVTQFPIFSWLNTQCQEGLRNVSFQRPKKSKHPKIHVGRMKSEEVSQEVVTYEEIPVYDAAHYESSDMTAQINEEAEALYEAESMYYDNTNQEGVDIPHFETNRTYESQNMESLNEHTAQMSSETSSNVSAMAQIDKSEGEMPEYVFPPIELLNKVPAP